MTAIPWGQKKRRREMIQSQTVTPPLAAIEGTTLRLKTATTKSSTRSRRPRARIRWGAESDCAISGKIPLEFLASLDGRPRRPSPHGHRYHMSFYGANRGGRMRPPLHESVCNFGWDALAAFLLGLRQRCGDIVERGQVLVDVSVGVLDGNRPLLIPPVRLSHYTAIDHAEPVMTPEIDVDRRPITVIHDLFRIEHQRAVGASLRDVSLQSDSRDSLAIAIRQLFAELVDVRVVLARQNVVERRKTRRHRDWIGVVRAAVEDLVLRDQVHDGLVRAEGGERQSSANRLGQADHVRRDAEVFTGAAPAKFGAGLYFVKDQQRAVLGANLAQALQEAALRHAEADVHQNRLENNRSDLAGIFFEAALHGGKVVEGRDLHVVDCGFGHAESARN